MDTLALNFKRNPSLFCDLLIVWFVCQDCHVAHQSRDVKNGVDESVLMKAVDSILNDQ